MSPNDPFNSKGSTDPTDALISIPENLKKRHVHIACSAFLFNKQELFFLMVLDMSHECSHKVNLKVVVNRSYAMNLLTRQN